MMIRKCFLFCFVALFSSLVFSAEAIETPNMEPLDPIPKVSTVKEGIISGHKLTAGDVEAFFDGFMPLQIEQADVAGQ